MSEFRQAIPKIDSALPESQVGEGCVLSGKLTLSGKVLIDCKVEGEIYSSGELIVGENSKIEAKISGTYVKVYGEVHGDIECSEKVELLGKSTVFGDIISPIVVMQDGVKFQGYCRMSADSRRCNDKNEERRAG